MPEQQVSQVLDPVMQDLQLEFGTKSNQVEANTLINSLIHLIAITQESGRQLNPDVVLSISVSAPRKGSFLLDVGVAAQQAHLHLGNLLTPSLVDYSASLVTIVGGVYNLYKKLLGKKAEGKDLSSDGNTADGQSVIIKGNDGTVNINSTIINVYNNPAIQEALASEFRTLASDQFVDGFAIKDESGIDITSFSKPDIDQLAELEPDPELLPDEEKVIRRANLRVIKPVLEGNARWEFLYKGTKILARIEDSYFQKKMDEGERFGRGDVLNVELEIRRRFDPGSDMFIDRSFKVIKVMGHHPPSREQGLSL